jgi:hypothetical protein
VKFNHILLALGIAAGFALALAASSIRPASAQQAAGGTTIEGIVTVVWGDPRHGIGGATRFGIDLPDGRKYKLEARPGQENMVLRHFGKRAVARGQLKKDLQGAPLLAVEQIEPGVQESAVATATTVRRVLYVLLKFRGDTQEPHPPSFFKKLTNPLTAPEGSEAVSTVNGFFSAVSWDQLRFSADVVGQGGLNATHWLQLPGTKKDYAPCGWNDACADLNRIKVDGLALAVSAGVDLAVYDNINFVLNNDLDCCAWGGNITYKGKSYGATWEPPWGQEAGTYVHELGHSIGLPHSGWVYYAYDSPWDQMSGGSTAKSLECGNYISANDRAARKIFCTEPGGGYITAHKDHLGWIPPANVAVIDRAVTRTIAIEANGLPLGTGIKMIKICYPGLACTGANAKYLTVEARISGTPFDDGLPSDGVIIHNFQQGRGDIGVGDPCFFNSTSGWAVPIDATKGDYRGDPVCSSGGRTWPNFALGNAAFRPGMTYADILRHVSVKVIRKRDLSYVVTVTRSQ